MIKSVEKMIKNRQYATYQEYKSVMKELRSKMFPEFHQMLTGDIVENGAKTYAEMIDYNEQIKILRNEFPLFAQKEKESFYEFSKELGHNFK